MYTAMQSDDIRPPLGAGPLYYNQPQRAHATTPSPPNQLAPAAFVRSHGRILEGLPGRPTALHFPRTISILWSADRGVLTWVGLCVPLNLRIERWHLVRAAALGLIHQPVFFQRHVLLRSAPPIASRNKLRAPARPQYCPPNSYVHLTPRVTEDERE